MVRLYGDTGAATCDTKRYRETLTMGLYTTDAANVIDTTTGATATFLDADTAELATADLNAGYLDPASLAWQSNAPTDILPAT